MNRKSLAIAALALAAACLTSAARADFLVDFNTADTITNDFTSSPTPITNMVAETDGIGLGGSRALAVIAGGTVDTAATYKTASLDFSGNGSKITVSAFIKTVDAIGTTGEDRIFELNIVANSTNVPIGAHDGVGGKTEFVPNADGFDDIGFEFRRNNADVAGTQTPDANAFNILPTNWYKVTFTATNNGAGLPIPATVALDDYGATGAALVTANVLTNAFDIPTSLIAPDVDVFAAFRVRNGNRLIAVIDNFEAKLTAGSGFNPADFDHLNGVTSTDLGILTTNFGSTTATNATGSADGDTDVDGNDFLIWQRNVGNTSVVATAGAIPEPAAGLLALIALALAPSLRRRG